MNSMTNMESVQLMKLINQAKDLGLLDSGWTLTCPSCHAIFPGEYQKCPKCSVSESFQNIQIDFEI